MIRRYLITALSFLLLLSAPTYSQWRKLTAYSNRFFNEVFFVDNTHGWLTGFDATVVYTADGGNTWSTSLLPGAVGSFNRDLCFLSTSIGFISGEDGIWKTTNGGGSWTNITPTGGTFTTGVGGSSWFIDANNGVYGQGSCADTTVRFYKTTDGGSTWTTVTYTYPTAPDVSVGGMTYTNGNYYASGGGSKLWTSTDGGTSWSVSVTSATAGWHEDLVSISGALHIASANGGSCSTTGSGKTFRSVNGGSTWTSVAFSPVMWGITMYSSTDGWCCGDGGNAFRTTDGGVTWTLVNCGMSQFDRLDDINFTDATHGWAVGDGIYKYVGDSFAARPDTINFGDILVATTSADSNAYLRALGGISTVSQRTITGLDSQMFAATGSLSAFTVASCTDLTTPLHFTPASEGWKYAQLNYTIANSTETPKVILKGRGVKPHIASVNTLQFDTLICSNAELDTFYVRNTGTYQLTINNAAFQNVTGGSFSVMTTLPVNIPPGDSARIIILATAVPGASAPLTGTLQLNNSDKDPGKSPWNIQLSLYRRAIGVTFAPDSLVVLPWKLIGDSSVICVTYTNSGNGNQSVLSVIGSGTDQTIMATTSSSPPVAPGKSTIICFRAIANDTMWHERRFAVKTSPCDRDTFITVRYQAHNPVINGPSSRTLPMVLCDGSEVYDSVHVTNTGNADLILNQPLFSGQGGTEFSVVSPATFPDTIPVGSSRYVVVRFTPSNSAGPRTVTMTIPNNDRFPLKNPYSVTFNAIRSVLNPQPDRRRIDVGDICVNTVHTETLYVSNKGTGAFIATLNPSVSSKAVSVLKDIVAVTITPSKSDSAIFSIVPPAVGPFTAEYVLTYDPCGLTDTIIVTGRGVGMELQSSPPRIDYGTQKTGVSVPRIITLTNSGTTDATITALTILPSNPTLVILDPPVPFIIPAGGSKQVTIQFTPTQSDTMQAMLYAYGSSPCGTDTLTAEIIGRGTNSVLSNCGPLEFGYFAVCDNTVKIDSTCLQLASDATEDITITGAILTGGGNISPAFQILSPTVFPTVLARGASLRFSVGVRGTFSGESFDTLIVQTQSSSNPEIRFPLHVRRELGNVSIALASSGASATELKFQPLSKCRNEDTLQLRISNTGSIADTITVGSDNGAFSAQPNGSIAPLVLPPGSDVTVAVIATMTQPGNANGNIRVQSKLCPIIRNIPAEVLYRNVAATVTGLLYPEVIVGDSIDKQVAVTNTGELDQTVSTVYTGSPSDFVVVGNYTGVVIPAGKSINVTVRFRPSVRGTINDSLHVEFNQPCSGLVASLLEGNAILPSERFIVRVGADTIRGRWGTQINVPIRFSNERNAPLNQFDLHIVASPTLLDVKGVAAVSNSGLQVQQSGYDPLSGTLRVHVQAMSGNVAAIPSRDTLCIVTYEVLRGDEIACTIMPWLEALPPNVVAESDTGAFYLLDYCDAYGRLIRPTGTILLRQNTPNPVRTTSVIEFETAFAGPVLLSVHDALGNNVLTLVNESLPAGQRRVILNASDLPSGVYTYRLQTGLQTLIRTMVVTK